MIKKVFRNFYFPAIPVLFSTSFVLAEYYADINELYIRSIFIPFIVVGVLTVVLFYLFKTFIKDKLKAEIFTVAFLVIFFSYGFISGLQWNLVFVAYNKVIGRNYFESGLLACLILFAYSKIAKGRFNLKNFKPFLFKMSILSFSISLLLVGCLEVQRILLPKAKSPLVLPKISTDSLGKNSMPDIYFILPEDDAAPTVFKNYFNYDESEFTDFLKNEGFYVADQATSNYPKTFESLASTLNMEYLDYLSPIYRRSSDLTVVNPLIENNNVMKFLKNLGYKYYQLGSWWQPAHFNPEADNNFILENEDHVGIDPFAYNLASSTMLSPILNKIIPTSLIGFSDSDDRQRILYQLSKIPQIVNIPGPKFVFAQIISPHGPYVFGKDCSFVTLDDTSKNSEETNYVNQTNCMNQQMETLVKTILATSKKPPVILLLTDEGVPFLNERLNPTDNWKIAPDTLIKEKFPILAAYYLPDVSFKSLYPTISAVNSFREVFNLYFNAGFSILPDKNYIFRSLNNLYTFIDVTNKVK